MNESQRPSSRFRFDSETSESETDLSPEKRSRAIAVVNQKGGCAKTTTAVNLAAGLARYDYRVLLIDTDPQGQACLGLGINVDEVDFSMNDVLLGGMDLRDATIHLPDFHLDVVAANSLLTASMVSLTSFLGRETILRSALENLLRQEDYDYIILDCSPSMNVITTNTLVAADQVIVPFMAHYYSVEGVKELFYTIEQIQQKLNPGLSVLGLLATMYDEANGSSLEILAGIRDAFPELLFRTIVRTDHSLSEAPFKGRPVFQHAPDSKGARDYLDLVRECVLRTQLPQPFHIQQ